MEEYRRWLRSGVLSVDSLGTMGSPFTAIEFSFMKQELVEVVAVRHQRREVVTRIYPVFLLIRKSGFFYTYL